MSVAPDDPGFLARLQGVLASPETRDLGLSLLANSGYSTTPRTFGQVAGQSALMAQQMQQQRQMEDIKRRYMEAQIQALQAKPEGYTLGPGQIRYDANGNAMASAPAAPDNLPADIQEYKYAQMQGYKGDFLTYQMEKRRAGAVNVNLGAQGLSAPPTGYYRPDPFKPGLGVEPGGPQDPKNKPPPPLTENDKKARVLYSSILDAEKQIQDLGKGADTGSITDVALGASRITAPLQSEQYRQYEAAGLRWAANLLYLKSGATANPDEIRSTWKQFFPQPGDTQKVKEQKEKARKQELNNIASVYGAPGAQPAQIFAPGEAPHADPLGILK